MKNLSSLKIVNHHSDHQPLTPWFKITTANAILCIILALIGLGLVMVYSSSFLGSEENSKFNDGYFFFKKQVVWIMLSLLGLFFAQKIPYQTWRKLDRVILVLLFGLLIAVLIPGLGKSFGGARRWFRFGPIGFQPSEFAKIALVIFIAGFISRNPERIKDFKKGFLLLSLILGTVFSLILMEPDIGTTVFLALVCFLLLFTGGLKIRHALPTVLIIGPIIFYMAITFFPHVQNRLDAFINHSAHTRDKGYQVEQALIGLGAGGLAGAGLGNSVQKLFFLPQEHTDFILAVIGEEAGLLGTAAIIFLFLALLWLGYRVFMKTDDLFGKFLALGITLIITTQAIMHTAVVTASIPNKGISLPFISFGGSAIFMMTLSVGILINIAKQSEKTVSS